MMVLILKLINFKMYAQLYPNYCSKYIENVYFTNACESINCSINF